MGVSEQSTFGNFAGHPCTMNEIKDFIHQLQDDFPTSSTDGFPDGVIAWWPGSEGSIPTNWAKCDGSANSAGSGLNVIDYMVLATGVDGEVGDTTAAAQTSAGTIHRHSFTEIDHVHLDIDFEIIDGYAVIEDPDASLSSHTHTITARDDYMHLTKGGHSHTIDIGWQDVDIHYDSRHRSHPYTISEKVINSHTPTQIENAIANHDSHRHFIPNILSNSGIVVHAPVGGPLEYLVRDLNVLRTDSESVSAHIGQTSVTHVKHDHDMPDDWMTDPHQHKHDNEHHRHGVDYLSDGNHPHFYLHKHPDVTSPSGGSTHTHNFYDNGHTHLLDVTISSHSHSGSTSAEDLHTHTTGVPNAVVMIPIERMPDP
jgi:hypothetical protein